MDINNIFNMDNKGEPTTSLSKALLIFYVIIASQYTGNLMGKQMKEFIQENRIAQHIIAFTMLLVLINLVGGVKNIGKTIIYSIIGYLWFIFTTKLDIHWNLIILCLLTIGYLYETNMFTHEYDIFYKDQVLTPEEKNKVVNKNKNIKTYIVGGLIIVTLIGSLLYEQKKGVQYGGGFSIVKYLLY
jgi:hypothetical protein